MSDKKNSIINNDEDDLRGIFFCDFFINDPEQQINVLMLN